MNLRLLAPLVSASCLWITPAEHELRTDLDRDGYGSDADCDDHDPLVAPGLGEVPCNGADDDCDPRTPDGPAANGPLTYAKIQDALDLAAVGSVITLCAGTFHEAVTIQRDGVSLSGNEAAPTILDASGLDRAVVTVEGGGVTVRNLTLTRGTGNLHGGYDRHGGGVDATLARGEVTLENLEIHGNAAIYGGGVMAPLDHRMSIVGSTIHDNLVTLDGGGVAALGAELVLQDTQVFANSALTGGGLYALEPAVVLGEGATEITGNDADNGGGVAGSGSVTGLEVRGNSAAIAGGGVYLEEGELVDVVVAENTSEGGGGGIAGAGSVVRGAVLDNVAFGQPGGGGVLATAPAMQLVGVQVERNQALVGDGGGLLVTERTVVDVTDDLTGVGLPTLFDRNEAFGYGGGLAVNEGSLRMEGGKVSGGTSARGGGVAFWAPCAELCDNLLILVEISGNEAQDGAGWWTDQPVTAESLFVADNVAAAAGGGMYVAGGKVTLNGSEYLRNSAVDGGAAWWSGSEGTLATTSFVANQATGRGGGLWIAGGALTASVTFERNTGEGPAVDGAGGSVALTGSVFDGNVPYDLDLCGAPCVANPVLPYDGTCTFPASGCECIAGYCLEPFGAQ